MANPTFNAGFYDFDNSASTTRTIACTIGAGANSAHALVVGGGSHSNVMWNGVAMTLVATRDSAGIHFSEYRIDNPDIGAHNFAYDVGAAYNGFYVMFAAVNDADIAGTPTRSHFELYSGGTSASPLTCTPSTPASASVGDLMLMFASDVDTFSSAHAAYGGATQIGVTDTRGLAVYKSAASAGDSIGVQFSGSMVGYIVGALVIKGAGSAVGKATAHYAQHILNGRRF